MTTPRDFLGQELAVGDVVVYPATSGRSTQMCVARLIKFTCVSEDEEKEFRLKQAEPTKVYGQSTYYIDARGNRRWERGPVIGMHYPDDDETYKVAKVRGMLAGTLTKVTVLPLGVDSRWEQHGSYKGIVKPVHLSANARSVVRVTDLPVDWPAG